MERAIIEQSNEEVHEHLYSYMIYACESSVPWRTSTSSSWL